MDRYSITPQEDWVKVRLLLMSEVFNEKKVDWAKLRATLGENINFSNERYELNVGGKIDTFRVIQQLLSAIFLPCREESVYSYNIQNIFIEREYMEVLKTFQKSYVNKIKMIYIDLPFNTSNNSFIYFDKFSGTKEEYMRRASIKISMGIKAEQPNNRVGSILRAKSLEGGRTWDSSVQPCRREQFLLTEA